MRISPQPAPCNPCFLLQVTQALVIGIAPTHPRESCSDQLVIQAPPVWQEYHAHGAPIAISIHDLHSDGLPEYQRGRELLSPLAKCLALFGAVDAMQSDASPLPLCRTVIVSPSETPTTPPVNYSATAWMSLRT